MKNIAAQMVNFDREQMRRIANNMPEQYDEKPQVQQVAQIINGVFSQLLATFPASLANRDQNEVNEIRRQWVLAFRENGITTMEQVNAGMRVARRQNRPFLPSPGQFVAWCREEASVTAGLPNVSELVDMVYEYCRKRGLYPDAESYPWKSNAHYWLVTNLYQNMRANALTDAELRRKAADELVHMTARINRGEAIPEPVKQLPVMGGRPLIPASLANRDQNEVNEIRRQWVLAFRENGITTMEQVNAGMRVARRQNRPFLPSPGQFVAWCREEASVTAGLPNVSELVDMVYEYCRKRGLYPDAESYPWKSNAHYWLVTNLYQNMRANALTDAELRRKAADELVHMTARINRGEAIPEPVKQLPVMGGRPLNRAQALAKIAEIKAKFGLKGASV
ncbi:DNA replication protein [Bacillus thuringiensis Sbt003]|nr:DNA replication protein [Bacillus thuringiensis Sbt003]